MFSLLYSLCICEYLKKKKGNVPDVDELKGRCIVRLSNAAHRAYALGMLYPYILSDTFLPINKTSPTATVPTKTITSKVPPHHCTSLNQCTKITPHVIVVNMVQTVEL